MKWIMLANSNDCRIYEYDRRHKHLVLVQEISHPENKLKVHDWTTDHPGHYKSGYHNRGSFEPETSPVEVSIDEFAREMAECLEEGRTHHKYDDITLMMPSRMEGLLNKHLNKHTKALVDKIIQKNLLFLSEHELSQYLDKIFNKLRKAH
ncbi:MAG TPA: host attachment protein [Legionellaceae bacterium]|nr:host attachment protein [Legionellaceae bacterium]